MTLEFLGRGVAVLDDELYLRAGRDREFGRFEPMILDDERERRLVGECRGDCEGRQQECQDCVAHRDFQAVWWAINANDNYSH